jgi:hypothetical protein
MSSSIRTNELFVLVIILCFGESGAFVGDDRPETLLLDVVVVLLCVAVESAVLAGLKRIAGPTSSPSLQLPGA